MQLVDYHKIGKILIPQLPEVINMQLLPVISIQIGNENNQIYQVEVILIPNQILVTKLKGNV